MLVDSHCHLEYKGLVEEQDAVLDRARTAGIGAFLNISTKRSEWAQVIATAHRAPDVYASVGIHPHNADDHQDLTEDALFEATQDPRVIGIGETGLDYFYEHSDREAQKHLFRLHIAVARRTGLPLIIHTRDAEDDTLEILGDEMGKGEFPALIHCFTASAEFGEKVLEMGLSISLSGIVTFKNGRELLEIARDVPAERLLVETDSPYLAPVPHRGKKNEPAFVRHIAQAIAEIREVSLDALSDQVWHNACALFDWPDD